MREIIERIIKDKIAKNEIIFKKNILNTLFLNDCTLFFEKNIEDIEECIDNCIENSDILIELSNGKYADKEKIKEICYGLNNSEIKKCLEERYYFRFENLNYEKVIDLLNENEDEEEDYTLNQDEASKEIHEENDSTLTFKELIEFGLENGYVTYDMLEKIDFEEDSDVYDLAHAYDILYDKGIRIEEK